MNLFVLAFAVAARVFRYLLFCISGFHVLLIGESRLKTRGGYFSSHPNFYLRFSKACELLSVYTVYLPINGGFKNEYSLNVVSFFFFTRSYATFAPIVGIAMPPDSAHSCAVTFTICALLVVDCRSIERRRDKAVHVNIFNAKVLFGITYILCRIYQICRHTIGSALVGTVAGRSKWTH